MNRADAVRLVTKMAAYFPGAGMGEANIAAYAKAVVNLDLAETAEAIDRLILRSPRLPSVADILAVYREVRQVTSSPALSLVPALPGESSEYVSFADYWAALPPEKQRTPGMLWLITLLEHYKIIEVKRRDPLEIEAAKEGAS